MRYRKEDTADCVGPGWRKIVQVLIDYCHEHGIEILQIKEKFASLRFYYTPFNEKFAKLVDTAERECEHNCEWCGKTEAVKTQGGLINTLCQEHAALWKEGKRWWDHVDKN